MTFETAVAFVLEQEGGLSNLAGDSGGLTKFGISKNNHPDLDIAALTQEQAIEIYRMDYWNKLHCNQPRPGDHAPQSSLEHAYYLYPTAEWIRVRGGNSGLVQPLRCGLGNLDHAGHELLFGNSGPGAGDSHSVVSNTSTLTDWADVAVSTAFA